MSSVSSFRLVRICLAGVALTLGPAACSSCDGSDPGATTDTDGDGVLDTEDAFPNDASETVDTDGDGVGDNSDAFPNDPTETLDTDGDGVGDNADALPNDPTETLDTDGDGVGDNADAFPNDPTETLDTDGDGVGDNSDAFPNDPTETLDTDGDGVGDSGDCAPSDATAHTELDGYYDGDGDTYTVGAAQVVCTDGTLPADYRAAASPSDDCDDTDENNWNACSTCLDKDADGYFAVCDAYVSIPGPDCDDEEVLTNPGAADLPDNGVDDDCAGGDLIAADGPGVYVDLTNDCLGTGTASDPYCQIQTAIDLAPVGSNVFITGGASPVYDALYVSKSINLFGGFHPGFHGPSGYVPSDWVRATTGYPARIEGGQSNTVSIRFADEVVVTLDQLVVIGPNVASGNVATLAVEDFPATAAVTIAHSTIVGGTTGNGQSTGASLRGPAGGPPVLIVDSLVQGGNSTDKTRGLWLGGNAYVINSTVTGGTATATADDSTTGIETSLPFYILVARSRIRGGSDSRHSHGMHLMNGLSVVIASSVIGGSATFMSTGIAIAGQSGAIAVNNVIGSGTAADYSYGVSSSASTANFDPALYNNVIAPGPANESVGIKSRGGIHIHANDIWSSSMDEVHAYYNGTDYTFNDLSGLNDCQWLYCESAADNISLEPTFGSLYHNSPGSPAIDAGVDPVSAVPERFRWYATRDLDFEVRPLDGNGSGTAEWDIGCDELAP